MTPDQAMKLRAGDFVTDTKRPGETGIVRARHSHLLYITWPNSPDQFLLTYDAQTLHRAETDNP